MKGIQRFFQSDEISQGDINNITGPLVSMKEAFSKNDFFMAGVRAVEVELRALVGLVAIPVFAVLYPALSNEKMDLKNYFIGVVRLWGYSLAVAVAFPILGIGNLFSGCKK